MSSFERKFDAEGIQGKKLFNRRRRIIVVVEMERKEKRLTKTAVAARPPRRRRGTRARAGRLPAMSKPKPAPCPASPPTRAARTGPTQATTTGRGTGTGGTGAGRRRLGPPRHARTLWPGPPGLLPLRPWRLASARTPGVRRRARRRRRRQARRRRRATTRRPAGGVGGGEAPHPTDRRRQPSRRFGRQRRFRRAGPQLGGRVRKEADAPRAARAVIAHLGAVPGRVQPVLEHGVARVAPLAPVAQAGLFHVRARDARVNSGTRVTAQGFLAWVRKRAGREIVGVRLGAGGDLEPIDPKVVCGVQGRRIVMRRLRPAGIQGGGTGGKRRGRGRGRRACVGLDFQPAPPGRAGAAAGAQAGA